MNKKHHYSDQKIQEGIDKGDFKVETINLVRHSNGQILKHMKGQDTDTIPATYVQINNNFIVERDITPFINAIIAIKDSESAAALAEEYEVVMGFLAYYRDHGERLDQLNSKSLEISSKYKSRTKPFLTSTDTLLEKGNGDRNIEIIDAYLNVIFIYVISTYHIHKKEFRRDTNSREQISQLKESILAIYKDLLIPNGYEQWRLSRSAYALIMNDKSYEISLIETLMKHDDRYSNALEIINDLRQSALDREYTNGSIKYYYTIPRNAPIESNIYFAKKLSTILDKIDNIQNIIQELSEAGQISDNEIEFSSDALTSHFSLFQLKSES